MEEPSESSFSCREGEEDPHRGEGAVHRRAEEGDREGADPREVGEEGVHLLAGEEVLGAGVVADLRPEEGVAGEHRRRVEGVGRGVGEDRLVGVEAQGEGEVGHRQEVEEALQERQVHLPRWQDLLLVRLRNRRYKREKEEEQKEGKRKNRKWRTRERKRRKKIKLAYPQ